MKFRATYILNVDVLIEADDESAAWDKATDDTKSWMCSGMYEMPSADGYSVQDITQKTLTGVEVAS